MLLRPEYTIRARLAPKSNDERLSNRNPLVKLVWPFSIVPYSGHAKRRSNLIDRASALLFSSEPSGARGKVVFAVDTGSPHNGSSQGGPSFVQNASLNELQPQLTE